MKIAAMLLLLLAFTLKLFSDQTAAIGIYFHNPTMRDTGLWLACAAMIAATIGTGCLIHLQLK